MGEPISRGIVNIMGKIAVHEEILELLPWFINESLGEKERDLVTGLFPYGIPGIL